MRPLRARWAGAASFRRRRARQAVTTIGQATRQPRTTRRPQELPPGRQARLARAQAGLLVQVSPALSRQRTGFLVPMVSSLRRHPETADMAFL